MLHGLWLPEITIRQGQDKRHVCSGRYRPEQKMGAVLTGATPYQQPVLKFSRQTACEGSGLIYLMSNTSLPFSL